MATAQLLLHKTSLLWCPIAAVWEGDWEACLDPVLLEAAGEVVKSLGTLAEGASAQQGQQQQMVAVNQPPMAEYRFQVMMWAFVSYLQPCPGIPGVRLVRI